MSAHLIEENESGFLPDGINFFHTPNTMGLDGGSNSRKALKKRQEMMWPTPRSCSAMAATITPDSVWNKNRFPNLETIVGRSMWPTPNASDHIQRKTSKSWAEQGRVNYVLSNPEITGVTGGKLNPTWVEWLMGWPIGWTDLKPLEMDKFQQWRQQHGEFLEENK